MVSIGSGARVLSDILRLSDTRFRKFLLIIVLGVVSSFLSVISTQFISVIVGVMQSPDYMPTSLYEQVIIASASWFGLNSPFFYVIYFGFFIVLSVILRNVFCYIASKNSNRMISRVRSKIFSQLLNSKPSFVETLKKSDIVYNVINNAEAIDNVFSTPLYTIVSDFFDFIWISVFLLSLGWKYFAVAVVFLPAIYFASVNVGKLQRKYHTEANSETKALVDMVDSFHDGVETIAVFNGKQHEQESFLSRNRSWNNSRNLADLFLSMYFPIEKTITTVSTVVLLLICLSDIVSGKLGLGMFPVIVVYISKYYQPITSISKYYQMIQRGISSLALLLDFDKCVVEAAATPVSWDCPDQNEAAVQISNFTVKVNGYRSKEIREVSFQKNGFYVIKGASGCGKSTLVKALIGFSDNYTGEVRILPDYQLACYGIAYSSQNAFICNGTVLENITYPCIPTEKDKIAITELAQQIGLSYSFINRTIDNRGKDLSGGERQRIGLLRAIYARKRFLILDEATANIDSDTEALIMRMLMDESKKRLVLLITHSTSKLLDTIGNDPIVMEKA